MARGSLRVLLLGGTTEASRLAQALAQAGDIAGAARSYLDAFSGQPDGSRAPEALMKLGLALGALGQTNEACMTLAEVGSRFAGTEAATEAAGRVTDRAVQIMGRFGLVRGSTIERLYREARPMRVYEGATEVILDSLARRLVKDVAARRSPA